MGNYNSVDLDFSWDGDFIIGKDGDLGDTSDDHLRALVNDIRDCVKSELGDWEKDPQFACDLAEFRGEANTRATGKAIENRVKSKIASIGLVKSEDLQVRVVPVHINQVAVMIKVSAIATSDNHLQVGEPILVNFVYDTTEHDIFFLPPNLNTNDPFLK